VTNFFLSFNTILYSLCNNKGAFVAVQLLAVKAAARFLLDDQGFDEIVVEDFLEGEEVLLLAFCDGVTAKGMPAAQVCNVSSPSLCLSPSPHPAPASTAAAAPLQDHKRVFDGDQGHGGLRADSAAFHHMILLNFKKLKNIRKILL